MKSFISFMVLCVLANSVNAGEVERNAKIVEILKAQGVAQQIEQQIGQLQGEPFERIARSMFDKIVFDRPAITGLNKQEVEEVLVRFVKRNTALLTAEDLIKVAAKQYGQDIKDSELDAILAYYKSPVGRKDVSATLRVASSLSETMLRTIDERLAESVAIMESELDELLKK